MRRTSRREFVKAGVTGTLGLGIGGGALVDAVTAGDNLEAISPRTSPEDASGRATGKLPIKKGLVIDMLPEKLSVAERMKLAKDAGFEVVQANTTTEEREAEELKKAAEGAGIRIDSVMNMDHWKYPLSSGDETVVAKSMEGMRTSLRNAKLWGSEAVLLVPAVVNPQTSYLEAWTRSQKQIRELIPMAAELKVVISIEEVWNKFLLSPLEMKKYIAEFESAWVRAWFDVGNVVLYGYPQDWIRTLGKSISNVHLKDFKRKEGGYAWVNLGDGDVDWGAVRAAFAETGYAGSAIAELDGGDEAYLRDVNRRIDRLLVGTA